MAERWVVVLEIAIPCGSGARTLAMVRRILRPIQDLNAVALHSRGRYAVQMDVQVVGPLDALGFAIDRWQAAVATVGVTDARLLRAELLSADEFERDCRLAYFPVKSVPL